jgi:hypothetical protein
MNSNWLLVELVPDLAAAMTTRSGVFAQIKQCAGVVCVADLSSITREILDEWLMPAEVFEAALKPRRPGGTPYNAIRRHHRLKLQPELPLEPKKARGRKAS